MKFIKLTENAILPTRGTKDSAGYDFSASETISIQPLQAVIVPTGITFEDMEPNHFLQLQLRSSVSLKRPVLMANAPGIIDSDYAGNPIGIILFNRSVSIPVTIEAGERIAQGILLQYHLAEEKVVTKKRIGGVGSTGK